MEKNREIKEEVKQGFEVDGVLFGLITQAFPPTCLPPAPFNFIKEKYM